MYVRIITYIRFNDILTVCFLLIENLWLHDFFINTVMANYVNQIQYQILALSFILIIQVRSF